MNVYVYGAKAPTHNATLVQEQMLLAHRYRNALVEVGRCFQAAKLATLIFGETGEPYDAKAELNARMSTLRKASGVY